jgi:hypothetical protein
MDKTSVRLFMQLGARVPFVNVVENSRSKASLLLALEIFGMSPRCLTQAQTKALIGLVNGRVDVESYIRGNYE